MTPSRVHDPVKAARFQDEKAKCRPLLAEQLALFHDPDDILEIRIPDARRVKRSVVTGFLPASKIAHYAGEIFAVTGDSVGAYFTPNRLSPDCLKRCPCRFADVQYHKDIACPKSASDGDVIARVYLNFDIDAVRADGHAGDSATDAEKGATGEVADSVKSVMREHRWPDPLDIDSGNGRHLYYRLPTPIVRADSADPYTPDTLDTPAVSRLLKIMAKKFDTPGAKIDPTVCNPSRIMRVPGTMARKGEDTPDRPHRLCHVLEVPDGWRSTAATGADAPASLVALTLALDPDGAIFDALKAKDSPKPPATLPVTAGSHSPADLPTLAKRERRATKYIAKMPAGIQGQDGSGATYAVAVALVNGFCLDEHSALGVMLDYNARCVPPWSESELRHKVSDAATKPHDKPRGWLLADKPGKVTAIASVHHSAQPPPAHDVSATPPTGQPTAPTERDPGDGLNESIDDPDKLARAVNSGYVSPAGGTLTSRCGKFHHWDGAQHLPMTAEAFRPIVQRAVRCELESAQHARMKDWSGEGERPTMPKVTAPLVTNVLDALRSQTNLPGVVDMPCWIRGATGPNPCEIVAAQNGLLHLPAYAAREDDAIRPNTPDFYNLSAVNFRVTAAAPPPDLWLKTVHNWWPQDAQSIDLLRQWIGYLLTPDNSQQKILLLVGAPRSGKGTVIDIIRHLVGAANCTSPTLGTLCGEFGAASLIGKSVALVGDARLSKRADTAVLTERLLTVSGNGDMDVNQKNRAIDSRRLTTRFVIATNEEPNLPDVSGALVNRFSVLKFQKSWLGNEDKTLLDRLVTELPGIFNWAVDGWKQLREQGKFTAPESSRDVAASMLASGSPVGEFVREKCVVGPVRSATRLELFDAYQNWCESEGRGAGDNSEFGRQLRAAVPSLSDFRTRISGKGKFVRSYLGIALTPPEDDADVLPFEKAQGHGEPANELSDDPAATSPYAAAPGGLADVAPATQPPWQFRDRNTGEI